MTAMTSNRLRRARALSISTRRGLRTITPWWRWLARNPNGTLAKKRFKLPTGRPRLIGLDGKERLLDDELTEALPVWSPDSAKVATGFDTDLMLYDAATDKPTQARIRLRDALIAASKAFAGEEFGREEVR